MKRLPSIEVERLATCLVPFANKLSVDIPEWATIPSPQQRAIVVAAAKLLLDCPTIRRNAQLWTHHKDIILAVLSRWGRTDDSEYLIWFQPADDEAFCEATDFGPHEKRWRSYNIIPAELDRLGTILTEIESEAQ